MEKIKKTMLLLTALITSTITISAQSFMKVVAADGTGDFKTIQDAVNACSKDGIRKFIFVKYGTYKEQVKIPNGVILSLLGGQLSYY